MTNSNSSAPPVFPIDPNAAVYIVSSELPHTQHNSKIIDDPKAKLLQKTASFRKQPAYRKTMWTHAEDQMLMNAVKKHGTNNWGIVAQEVAGRTGKQCRERWAGILNPNLAKLPWTDEEDALLKKLHAQYGNKWALIAMQMKGRSTIALRNRWSFHLRHAYQEIKSPIYNNASDNINNQHNELYSFHANTVQQLPPFVQTLQPAPINLHPIPMQIQLPPQPMINYQQAHVVQPPKIQHHQEFLQQKEEQLQNNTGQREVKKHEIQIQSKIPLKTLQVPPKVEILQKISGL